jgi:DNA-binding MarR family transcriptional regulator
MSNNVTRSKEKRSPGDEYQTGGPTDSAALGMLPGLVGYRVRLAQMAIFSSFDEALAHLDLSPGLFGLLVIVEANPGLKQNQLAVAARLDRSTLVPALDRLESRGLLERQAAPCDKRSNAVFLTPKGTRHLARAKIAVEVHEQDIGSALNPSERAQLLTLLDALAPRHR